MAERIGDDRTQNNVQQATEKFNLNPPDWFTNEIREIKKDIDSGFKISEYRHVRLYNMFRIMNRYPAAPVPFLNAEAIMNELPPIV